MLKDKCNLVNWLVRLLPCELRQSVNGRDVRSNVVGFFCGT